ncbi:MAG TPA: hypothetical protein VL527_02010 [Dongiaceae bacterium]|nr:hypothetical protein [Dongiaceae bacterium]
MKLFRLIHPRWLLALVLSSLVFAVAGCSTTDQDVDNQSARPWNSPKGWENGLPTDIMEGH